MIAGRIADRRWTLALGLLAGCFADNGLHSNTQGPDSDPGSTTAGGATEATATTTATSLATTAGTSEATTSTSTTATSDEPPPTCGNNIIEAPLEVCDDGNLDDGDACLSTCQPAKCGDGILWQGVEACDDGPNNSLEPGACRPDCQLPACGDGGLYVGPLGAAIALSAPNNAISQGNDAPRSIAADGSDQFAVVWRFDAATDQIPVQRVAADGSLNGQSANYQTQPTNDIRDPVIAAAPNGDTVVVWETGSDVVLAARIGGGQPTFDLATVEPNGTFISPSVGISPAGRAAVAFLAELDPDTRLVYVRLFPDLGVLDKAAPEQQVSDHVTGSATPPTVAFDPNGAFLVAWGDPNGQLRYRRFDPDGKPGAIVTTDLRIGAPDGNVFSPWTGAALQAHDSSAVLAGLDAGGHLALQRFDAADAKASPVQVDEQDPRFVQFVDLASDPWGNLAVAWNACGTPLDVGATSCNGLAQRWKIRWFFADLDPLGPSTAVFDAIGATAPLSVAFAPNGVTAVTYVEGNQAKVRLAPLACP